MIYQLIYKKAKIRFEELGQGNTLVLLHGFVESLDIFSEIADKLKDNYRIICIDLPGQGKSDLPDETLTIAYMADAVKAVLDHCKIEKCIMFGHSLGGYVTLDFENRFSKMLAGFGLLNSVPFADNETRKAARDLTIKDIETGKKAQVCKAHVDKTFAPDNLEKLNTARGFAKIIALNTPDEGIIAVLRAMKNRQDYSSSFKNTNLPVLYINGKHDNFITAPVLADIKLPEKCTFVLFENSGHQSFIEEKDRTISEIVRFSDMVFYNQ